MEKEMVTQFQKKHLLNIIDSFLKLFGEDEYLIFHNDFMLPLLERKNLLNITLND
jgi:hypothetical protein